MSFLLHHLTQVCIIKILVEVKFKPPASKEILRAVARNGTLEGAELGGSLKG
jgi:hypothetical protein